MTSTCSRSAKRSPRCSARGWSRPAPIERVNVNGGSIGLGPPRGSTGARLMTILLHDLERRGGRYGLQSMCCGGGLGTATIIERLDG
jgi:acetyl-CoA acetyltransferase